MDIGMIGLRWTGANMAEHGLRRDAPSSPRV